MLNAIVAATLAVTSVDLEAGTVMCRSESTAAEYIEARQDDDESRLTWLGGSCYTLARDFPGQRLIGSSEQLLVVEWTNGRFRKVRYVIQGV